LSCRDTTLLARSAAPNSATAKMTRAGMRHRRLVLRAVRFNMVSQNSKGHRKYVGKEGLDQANC
jgi:hypothetical protein